MTFNFILASDLVWSSHQCCCTELSPLSVDNTGFLASMSLTFPSLSLLVKCKCKLNGYFSLTAMSTFKSFLCLLIQFNSGSFQRVEARQVMMSQSYRHFGGYRVMRDAVVRPLYGGQYTVCLSSLSFCLSFLYPFSHRGRNNTWCLFARVEYNPIKT